MQDNRSTRLHDNFADLISTTDMVIDDITLPRLYKTEEEWEKFIKGKPINTDVVPKLIYESWLRSMEYGVNPYFNDRDFLSQEEIKKQILDSKSLVSKFGNIIIGLQRMARKKGSIVQLFDNNARNIQLIAFSKYLHQGSDVEDMFPVPDNAAELHVGTNAISIALRENKSIQVSGPQHFNKYLHDCYCSAAPIHNSKGEIIGALNITSNSHKQNKLDTLVLVTFLARILDNISFTTDALGELDNFDTTINRTIEYLPQGIVHFSNNNEISRYNDKIIEMLEIDKANPQEDLSKYLSILQGLSNDEYLENREVSLDIRGSKKNFMLTTKNIYKNSNNGVEKIIILEKAKIPNRNLQGNEAIYTFDDIIGNNEAFNEAKDLAKIVAESASSVLLFGESGTGKELFAQAIHNASTRKDNPFVAINCGAIPHELVESELFGYESGAFTGASKGGKLGKLEVAFGGTLFLDEIESMPVNIQVKLLRALSTSKICRVGGIKEIPIDIRLVSATKKDLLQEADSGNFREDLYYRIGIFTLNLPALRERKDDIPVLAKHFIEMFSKELELKKISIEEDFFEALSYYYWRGNIRELRNVIERTIVLLGKGQELTKKYLPEKIVNAYNYKSMKKKINIVKSTKNDSNSLIKMSEEIIIEKLLLEEKGNLGRVAMRMGISRPTLNQKIKSNEKLKHKVAKIR
ncbi:MAG: sigma 54-interacting transcriptional regulator [Desulfotomaculaceae bacterium]|nr:sigma 54-interacting transcriptional regulator [Desulfotomaculaceae bacterium]